MADTRKNPPKDGRPTCTAKKRSTGTRCQNTPPKNFTVCRLHGGASPAAKNKAAERQLEEQARNAVAKLNIVPIGDPLTALSELAGEAVAWKDFLYEKVAELRGTHRYESEIGTEQLRAELVLYERALDRCVATLGVIAKLNIDERLAAIEERQAKMIEDGLFAAFEEAGLTMKDADTKERIARSFSRHLSLVS